MICLKQKNKKENPLKGKVGCGTIWRGEVKMKLQKKRKINLIKISLFP
jgi:hypothetical protein